VSWRDNLRPASFRGVAFEVSEHTVDLGRRFAVHEYPLRDAAEIEDMGKLARTYSVEAREAEIIARNGIVHPLFVSPRTPLEVLTDV